MTVLSDRTIDEYIDRGIIGVDPTPTDEQIQPASLDVRLGDELYDFETDDLVAADAFRLKPFQRYLGRTKEVISLPSDVAAQLAGRSTIGRMGVIVHKTAGWIDPSFHGSITLELMNMGDEPITLKTDTRIAQLVFQYTDRPTTGYDGSYNGQIEPTPAKEL